MILILTLYFSQILIVNAVLLQAQLHDWENFKMPGAPYEGMGPLPPLPEYDPALTRHYVIPEEWFEFLYPRTGATGEIMEFTPRIVVLLKEIKIKLNCKSSRACYFAVTGCQVYFSKRCILPTIRAIK